MPSSATEPRRGPSRLALSANLAVIYVVWGSTYLGIAIAIESIPPFLMATIRFAIAGAILLAFDLLRHPEARHWPTRRQLLDSAIVGALLLGIGNGFVSFGEQTVPSGISTESVFAIAYLVVFGSMLAYTAYGWLLKNAPLSLVGTYAYVNPVVAVALGGVFLHEGVSARTIVAAAIILVAVAIIVTARARLAATPEPAAAVNAREPAEGRSGARA